ncbi:MAG: tetratricopeptide repeat protein [Pelobium sp.]
MIKKSHLIIYALIFIGSYSYAQKGKINKQQEVVMVTGKVLNHEDSTRIMQLYYSGLREKVVQNQTLAIDYFNQVLQIDPSNHSAYYELAQLYFNKGDLKNAQENAQKAVTIKTDNEWYWLLAANIYQQQQEYTLLDYALNELIKISPENLDYKFDQANALFMMGKQEESLTLYNSLEKQVGLTDRVIQGRQRIYLKKGNIEKAAADLEQLIKNNPSDVRYYLFLGDLYYSNNMIPQALTVYQQAKSLDSSNAFTRLAIAQIFDSQKKPNDAFLELKEAFKQPELNIDQKVKLIIKYFDAFPNADAVRYAEELSKILTEVHADDPKSFSLYGDVLFQKGDLKNAETAYEKALSLNKNVYAIWDQLLRIQLSLNEPDDLIKKGEEALSYFPNQPSLYFYTALGYLQNKKHQNAIDYLNNTLNFDIESNSLKAQIYSSLGDAYQELKKYKESETAYVKALELEPDNTYTLNNYAYYLSLRNEDLDKAAQMSLKSNQLEPNNASFEDTYAWVLFKKKNYKEAKVWIEKAIKNNDKSAAQFDHYGDILIKLGETEDAISNWKKALSLEGDHALIERKINEKKYIE